MALILTLALAQTPAVAPEYVAWAHEYQADPSKLQTLLSGRACYWQSVERECRQSLKDAYAEARIGGVLDLADVALQQRSIKNAREDAANALAQLRLLHRRQAPCNDASFRLGACLNGMASCETQTEKDAHWFVYLLSEMAQGAGR